MAPFAYLHILSEVYLYSLHQWNKYINLSGDYMEN